MTLLEAQSCKIPKWTAWSVHQWLMIAYNFTQARNNGLTWVISLLETTRTSTLCNPIWVNFMRVNDSKWLQTDELHLNELIVKMPYNVSWVMNMKIGRNWRCSLSLMKIPWKKLSSYMWRIKWYFSLNAQPFKSNVDLTYATWMVTLSFIVRDGVYIALKATNKTVNRVQGLVHISLG